MDNVEVALVGWKEISKMLPFSERKLRGRYGKELRESGVIFFVRRGHAGRRSVAAFPSIIRRWAALKGMAGETL